MRTCSICQSPAELDDVVFTLATEGCICLRCYCRETDSTLRPPAGLWRAIEGVLRATRTAEYARPPAAYSFSPDPDAAWFPRDWKPWWQSLYGAA